MSNPSKQKGTKWETDIVRWLKENGFPDAKRIVLGGRFDLGDIEPVPADSPPIILSAKYGYGKDIHPQTEMFQKWWSELADVAARRNPDAALFLCHHREGKGSPEYAHWYTFDSWWGGPIKVTAPQALRAMERAAYWDEEVGRFEDDRSAGDPGGE